MQNRKKMIAALAFLLLVFTFAAPAANAKDGEYDQIVRHLKTKYRAKKVKIPFIWLARAVVSVVRPAGVKSFSVTIFQDLQFSRETLDGEMQDAMRNSLGEEWGAILRVRSRQGQQVYMYMREAGKSVKIMLVAIDQKESAIVRATINPEKLAEFVNDPKIFGVSLNDSSGRNEQRAPDGSAERSLEGLKDLDKIVSPDKVEEARKAEKQKEEKPKEEVKKDN
jgi:hypothetical protein